MEMTLEAVRKNLEYLEHHGVKGQRWGIRRTPEQLGHILKKKNARHYGKYNAAVKKISKIQGTKTINELSPKEKAKITKAVNKAENYLKKMESTEEKYGGKIQKAETRQAKSEEKAATKAENERVKNEVKKNKLIEKQDWEGIMENKNLFTERELSDIATRVNTEKRLKEALEGPNKMDKLADKIKSAANLTGAGIDLYNKVKGVSDILSEGKKEKAYAEIRELMAEGNNAEVIKKSIGISDKDVEVFNKRKTFLDNLKRDIPQNKESSQTEQPTKSNKKETEKKEKETKEKKETFKNIKNTLSNGLKEMADETISKEQKKQSEKINKNLYEFVNSNKEYDSRVNIDITREPGSWNKDPTLKGTVEGTGNSFKTNQNNESKINDIIDVPYTEVKESKMITQKDKYLPLVLNDIGDFKIDDLKK